MLSAAIPAVRKGRATILHPLEFDAAAGEVIGANVGPGVVGMGYYTEV